MSLLLDALKKAAEEKQNTSSSPATPGTIEERAQGQYAEYLAHDNPSPETEIQIPYELELYDETLTLSEPPENAANVAPKNTEETSVEARWATPAPSTITDEALHLLIRKTNHTYKKNRIVTWVGIVAASLASLVIGGVAFYLDMLADIENMQHEHVLALKTLESKTRIEENLTSLAEPAQSRQEAKAVATTDSESPKRVSQSRQTQRKPAVSAGATPALSVQRAEKRDPLSEALEQGWNAYHDKDYDLARTAYTRVLNLEPDNRDAMLGLAAVSVQQNRIDAAKDLYIQLLEMDPRDPDAHAGLASIAQNNGSELSETRLKQLIEHEPDNANLQFMLGNLYVKKNSWPKAQQAYFNAWTADRQNPDYAYNLAVSLDRLGKHEAAIDYYQSSLKLAMGRNVGFSPDAVTSRLSALGVAN